MPMNWDGKGGVILQKRETSCGKRKKKASGKKYPREGFHPWEEKVFCLGEKNAEKKTSQKEPYFYRWGKVLIKLYIEGGEKGMGRGKVSTMEEMFYF